MDQQQGTRARYPWPGKSFLIVAVAVIAVLVAAIIVSFRIQPANGALARQSASARLAAQAVILAQTDPRLAAQLAAASYRLSPGTVAGDALFQVASDNSAVARVIETGNTVNALAEDPNGEYLYAASLDGALTTWDMLSGNRIAGVMLPLPLESLTADPDGPYLAGVDWNGNLVVWNTGNARLTRHLEIPNPLYNPATNPVQIVRFDFFDSGHRLFALYSDGAVYVYDARTGAPLGNRAGTLGPAAITAASAVNLPSASPAQATVFAATSYSTVLAINFAALSESTVLSSGQLATNPTSIEVQPGTAKDVAISAASGTTLWDLSSGRLTWDYPVSTLAAGFDEDSSDMALQTPDGVALMPLSSASGTAPVPSGQGEQSYGGSAVVMAAPTNGGTLIAAGSGDGSITIIDPAERRLRLADAPASTVLAFNERGDLILSSNDGGDDRTTSLYLANPGGGSTDGHYGPIVTYKPAVSWWPSGDFYVNAVTSGGGYLFAAGQDPQGHGVVLAWDEATGRPTRRLLLPGRPTLGVDVRYDSQLRLLIVRDSNGQVDAWSTTDWSQVLQASAGSPSGNIDLSPDGSTLAEAVVYGGESAPPAQQKGRLVLIDLRSHALHQVAVALPFYRVAWTPGGKSLAVTGDSDVVQFISPAGKRISGAPTINLPGVPTDMAYSPDGALLAISLADGRILVYDPATGSPAFPPLSGAPYSQAENVAWSPDGSILSAALGENTGGYTQAESVGLWLVDSQTWDQQDCSLGGGGLPPAQWQDYVGSSVPYEVSCAGVTEPSQAPAALSLHYVDWRGVTLPAHVCQNKAPLTLHQGSASVSNPSEGLITVSALSTVAYGDLNESPVAGLPVVCSVGASGILWQGFVIFTGAAGTLRALGTIGPAHTTAGVENPFVARISITRDRVTAYEDWFTPKDPLCCASGRATTIWLYHGEKFIRQSTTVTAG